MARILFCVIESVAPGPSGQPGKVFGEWKCCWIHREGESDEALVSRARLELQQARLDSTAAFEWIEGADGETAEELRVVIQSDAFRSGEGKAN
jgi:hypothetical protein